ncbi:FHA domain-containing protein [Solimonas fluminis]|uniref:FHA domain-containing protein n=1 Tax=Solimonas fluminis TaxID=2086571 RepID=UPI001A9C75E8|nr:FHA domain-containing protein [Solimonas fluminis]
MAKIIRKSGASTEEWPLGQTSLSIGRRPDNHIVLPDTFASGRHAMIGYVNGRYFVEDLKSSNGTILNGQRISRAPLKNGDVIYIGAQRLEFHDQSASVAAAAAADTMATTIMRAPVVQEPPPDSTLPLTGVSAVPVPPRPSAAAEPGTEPLLIPALSAVLAPPPAPPPPPPPPPVAAAPPPPKAPPPASLPSSPIAGFNFILPELGTPKPAEPAAPPSVADPLEGMARSIRAHREREQQDKQENEAKLRAEWEKIVSYSETLQAKLKDDPRIRYFNVSRRSGEVAIRVQPDPKLPQQSIVLSQEHPDHKTGVISGVWLRMTGMPDRCHSSADAVIGELARTVAFLFV